jgi:hypothetical protein
MSTNEPGIPNQAEPSAPSPYALSPSEVRWRRIVHLVFIIALVAILAWKYYLYYQSPATAHGITARRAGASCSQLLLWLFSYGLCISGSRKLLLLILAGVTLFVGLFTLPILGWIGIVVMYFIYKRSAPASPVTAAASASAPR